jgi:hypothetical protein
MSDCRYWLAETVGPMAMRLIDGCHDSPEGVAKAAKLHQRIFGVSAPSARGPWIMVEISPVPDVDVAINEQAADECRALLNRQGSCDA